MKRSSLMSFFHQYKTFFPKGYCLIQQIQSLNIMNKGNTVFYHNHIQSNITKLDERKDRFINHRLQFLKQFCEPIQERIDAIQKEIQRYKIMRDTQEEVIQNDPDILGIKQQLKNYMHTHTYYQEKLNQYQKKSIDLELYNKQLSKRIQILRKNIKSHRQDFGFQLPSINKTRLKTSSFEKTQKEVNRSLLLPDIKNQTEDISNNGDSRSTKMEERKRIIGIGQKIQRIKSHKTNQQQMSQQKKQLTNSQKEQKIEIKKNAQQLRQKITNFNRTQILFHQCFEAKKASVQKSVSQLQSKLITNRVEFLSTCQAIGSKQTKIPFQQFKRLSCDQIITLFISFVWLNRRLNNEFLKKRKQIMDLIKKLPKIQ